MSGTEPNPGDPTADPLLRVVRGEPTPEQLAALVVVLAARAGGGAAPDRRVRRWADRSRAIGAPLRPGRGAWSAASPGPR